MSTIIFGENHFQKKSNNFFWWTLSKNFWVIAKFFGIVIKTAFSACRLRCQRKKPFLEKKLVEFFSNFEQTSFGTFARKLAGLSIFYFTCPQENLEDNLFLRKLFGFIFLPNLQESIFELTAEDFDRVVKTAFSVSRETFWGETSSFQSKTIFYCLSNLGLKCIRLFCKNFPSLLSKLLFWCLEECFNEK